MIQNNGYGKHSRVCLEGGKEKDPLDKKIMEKRKKEL
jgi:hypothetical protein